MEAPLLVADRGIRSRAKTVTNSRPRRWLFPGATPPLVHALDAAARGAVALPLSRFSDADVEWAIETGLGPLLHHVTRDDPSARGSAAWRQLRAADLTARVLTGVWIEAVTEILDAGASRIGPITLLKGSRLAFEYPEPQLRPMRDVDLLVDEGDVPGLEAILERLGYRRISSMPAEFYTGHHHTIPFQHPGSGVWVEVHHHLFRPGNPVARDALFDPEHIRAERRPVVFQGRPALRLSDELLVAHIASHWGVQLQRGGGMVAMLDLIYLLSRSADCLDWDRLLGWLRGSTSARYVYLLVTYLARHGLLTLPPRVIPSLRDSAPDVDAVTLGAIH
jgi:hypothetical protein